MSVSTMISKGGLAGGQTKCSKVGAPDGGPCESRKGTREGDTGDGALSVEMGMEWLIRRSLGAIGLNNSHLGFSPTLV